MNSTDVNDNVCIAKSTYINIVKLMGIIVFLLVSAILLYIFTKCTSKDPNRRVENSIEVESNADFESVYKIDDSDDSSSDDGLQQRNGFTEIELT